MDIAAEVIFSVGVKGNGSIFFFFALDGFSGTSEMGFAASNAKLQTGPVSSFGQCGCNRSPTFDTCVVFQPSRFNRQPSGEKEREWGAGEIEIESWFNHVP